MNVLIHITVLVVNHCWVVCSGLWNEMNKSDLLSTVT